MIHHFLINPAAGKGTYTEALVRKITRACEGRGVGYRIHTTKRPYDATDYVRAQVADTSEVHRFYACGGDGTFSETVNGAPMAKNAEFGLIPIGTGNDFERNFTGFDNFFDIERQLDGKAVRLDVMRCNDRFAFNVINVGFDSNVAKKTGEIKRSPLVPSGFAYTAALAITLCKPFGTRMEVELGDGSTIQETLLLAAVANGGFYGGGYHVAPRSSLTDGLLDVCIVNKISRARFLGLVGSYKAGTHLENEKAKDIIRYYQTAAVTLRFDTPVGISVDGEVEMNDMVRIEVIPRAFAFSIPDGSSLASEESEKNEVKAEATATLE
ncbi:MAG: diacylglycerol kinase family lipid kinase [Clostridia bacterium]|nr:diacylglycerol kinase family lipid kinase [Clostridia bacterium]